MGEDSLNQDSSKNLSTESPYIVGVVVTYFPEENIFSTLLSSLLEQIDFVIITDNTPTSSADALEDIIEKSGKRDSCQLIKFGENLGIAKALNAGICRAQALGADFILLSDQDSQPANDMVAELLMALSNPSTVDNRVGAAGPVYTDLHTEITYPFQAKISGRFFYGHKLPNNQEPIVDALTLITSGTLVPVDVFKKVGLMKEDLFIDYVDIEWCHRVRSEGYQLLGIGSATMFHRMGDDRLHVWYLGWRTESEYSPLRLYYRVRNYIALCKFDYIDWRWKVRSGWYSLGLVYSHVFFSGKPLDHLKMICRGIADGIIGKMGAVEESGS